MNILQQHESIEKMSRYLWWPRRCCRRRAGEELIVLAVGEADERQVVPRKGLRRWEVLVGRVVFDILKVRRVVVGRQVGNNGRHAVPVLY